MPIKAACAPFASHYGNETLKFALTQREHTANARGLRPSMPANKRRIDEGKGRAINTSRVVARHGVLSYRRIFKLCTRATLTAPVPPHLVGRPSQYLAAHEVTLPPRVYEKHLQSFSLRVINYIQMVNND